MIIVCSLFYRDLLMGSTSSPPLGSWRDLLSTPYSNPKAFSLSYVLEDKPTVSFSQEDLDIGQKEWGLSLIGYAIGK